MGKSLELEETCRSAEKENLLERGKIFRSVGKSVGALENLPSSLSIDELLKLVHLDVHSVKGKYKLHHLSVRII